MTSEASRAAASGIEAARQRSQRRWMSSLRRNGGSPLALAVAIPIVSGLVLMGQAMLLAKLLRQAIGGTMDMEAMAPGIGLIVGAVALRGFLSWLGERAAVAGVERIKLALRDQLFHAVLLHSPHWMGMRASGSLGGALVDQVEVLDGFFTRFLPAMVPAAILPLVFAAVVLPVDWVVGLLFLVTAPLVPLFMALVGWGAQAASEAQASALSRLSASFADRLRGLSSLVIFGRAEAEAQAMGRIGAEWRQRTMTVLRIAFLSSAVLEFFAALGVAGVALYVGLSFLGMMDLRTSPLTLEAGLFCLLMAPEIYAPLRQLAAHYHDRAGALAAVGEIARQFDVLPDPRQDHPITPDIATPLAAQGGPAAVAVSGLTLTVPGTDRVILDQADLMVPAGRGVALVGPSGCGKTTFLMTLARLCEAEGTILLGSRPLAGINERDLRAHVAFLSQRPRIFHGSIADNIRLGRPDADAASLRRAAEQAMVAAFADGLADGLDSLVGDGGLGLSGGEAHRVALARLYLRDPSLILLDEPTAHLDPETEDRVLDNLLTFSKGRTLIVATHSQRLAARMDLVLSIEGRRLLPMRGAQALPTLPARETAA